MLTLIGVSINDCPINEKVIIVVILNVAIFVFMSRSNFKASQ